MRLAVTSEMKHSRRFLRSRTHIRDFDSLPQGRPWRSPRRSLVTRWLLDGNIAISATGLRNSPPENSRAVRACDLRENCHARILENAAAEILQTVPKVSGLSHREKKSFSDSDMPFLREG